jgi:leucyl/phenylalanyl-tRNA--protein transferase
MPVYQLTDEMIFPHPGYSEEDGLLAVGGDLSVERLKLAYSYGIFPWYSEGYPILWWSTNPRMVLFPEKLKVSKSLQNIINRKIFSIKFDTCFEEVIKHCAEVKRKGQDETWITQEMTEAYISFHNAGYCHSVETFFENKLVGGLYGVSIGKAFFGESMFHLMSNASKLALYYLVEKLREWDFMIIDVQQETSHLSSLGAELIPREDFLGILEKSNQFKTKKGKWTRIEK